MLNLAALSRRLRSRAWRQRGMVLTLDALIALVIAAGGVVGIGTSLVHIMSGAGHAIQARDVFAGLDRAETTTQAKADSANAFLAPPNAIGGGANCAGGRCVSFAAYLNDSNHRPYFWALQATTKRGSPAVQPYKCTGTDASGNLSGCAVDGTAIVVPQGFYYRIVPVTALSGDPDTSPSTKAHLAALGITPKRVTFAFEHAGVVSSNDVYYLHFGSSDTGDDVLALSVRAVPTKGASLVDGHYLPTPPPAMDHSITGPGPQVFAYPGAAAAGFTVHEFRYHDAFSVQTSCMMGAVQVASISPGSASPNPNPISPPGQDSGPATFTSSPLAPGLCNTVVTDTYNQTISQAIQVMGPLQVAPNALTFSVPGATSTYPSSAGVSATKTYDQAAIALSFSGCGGIATATAGAASYPAAPSGSTPSSTPFTIAALAPGSCTLSVGDQYGEVQTVAVNVFGALTVNPANMTFANAAAAAQNAVANEGNYRGVITIANGSPSCAGYANASPGSQNTDAAFNATFSVSPVAPTPQQCSLIFTDDHGGSASVQVIVQNPQTTCPNGSVVGFGTPCPAVPNPPPPPPPPCTIDAFGFCGYFAPQSPSTTFSGAATCGGVTYYNPYSYTYSVYTAGGLWRSYTASVNVGTVSQICGNGTLWDRPTNYTTYSPSDPGTDTGDPNLPISDPVPGP